jgi:glycosyltransferase involved in cell wall biosynthesis
MGLLTIVTACAGREDNLEKSIASWKALNTEIIVSDFNTKPIIKNYLSEKGILSDKINVIHTGQVGQPWCLTWAYNLAFKHVRSPVILKLDADDLLDFNAYGKITNIAKLSLMKKCVFRGNWLLEGKVPSPTSSGVFIMPTELLLNLRGFTPFILTYGYDDIDLYRRASLIASLYDMPSSLFKKIAHSKIQRYTNINMEAAELESCIRGGLRAFTCVFNSLIVHKPCFQRSPFHSGALDLASINLSSLETASIEKLLKLDFNKLINKAVYVTKFPTGLAKQYICRSLYGALIRKYFEFS